MSQFELVISSEDGGERRLDVESKGLIIGRSPDADILLADALVSRQHARVYPGGEGVVVEDLGSRNGVLISGERITKANLDEGDAFSIGPYTFTVERLSPLAETSTMISYEKANDLYESIINDSRGGRLPLLYKAAQLLGTEFDLDVLFNKVLQLIFEALPVRRAFVLNLAPHTNEPIVRASLIQGPQTEGTPFSKTLVRHVVSMRASVLTSNAQEDERFDGAASILGQSIKSAMCAPLYGRDDVVGAIYVDAAEGGAGFTNDDLEVLTAIGKVVGVAYENARMHQESIENERLVAIGEATAGLGHCVKNILAGMKGGGELVEMALIGKDIARIEKAWPLVQRGLDRIETLMMNLLTYSRERTPDLMPTDVNDIITEIIEMTHHRAEQVKATIEFVREEIGSVPADGRELYRVILNLVTNAIEACEEKEGCVITLSTRRTSAGCYIDVADTGMGIPPEILPRLSQAFVSTKGSRGTGLGLACSYKIIREHGGTITVASEVGKGTTFTVFLPVTTMITARG